eukprot:SAG11_NODE_28635_length_319_cov_1.168182_2_plen_31_part_01
MLCTQGLEVHCLQSARAPNKGGFLGGENVKW